MVELQAFQIAARRGGFEEVKETAEGTVLWFEKKTPETAGETHQRMCIDSLTKSATVYWMAMPGKVSSKTFRRVPALQEWIEIGPGTCQQGEVGTQAVCGRRRAKLFPSMENGVSPNSQPPE